MELRGDHPVNCIAATTTNTDNFDPGALAGHNSLARHGGFGFEAIHRISKAFNTLHYSRLSSYLKFYLSAFAHLS